MYDAFYNITIANYNNFFIDDFRNNKIFLKYFLGKN